MWDVFITSNDETPSLSCKLEGGSLGFITEDFDAKKSLQILLYCNEYWTVTSSSTKGGTSENLLFFISFNNIANFFWADIEGFREYYLQYCEKQSLHDD